MLKRIITGAGVVVTLVGFFLLRQFVDYRLFNILIFAFAVFGTFEILRAFKEKVTPLGKTVVWVYALSAVPVVTFLGLSSGLTLTFAALLLILCTLVFEFGVSDDSAVGHALIAALYPTGLLVLMAGVNTPERGFIALLLVFVIAPFSDTGAFAIGSLLKGKKLCPNISPNKTISGFIGGLIVGAVGATLIWFIFPEAKGFFGGGDAEWIVYFGTGLIGSAISAFGDLVEGAIKRKTGIKDMGDMLPGHGGILDRIDSTMFTAIFVFFIVSAI